MTGRTLAVSIRLSNFLRMVVARLRPAYEPAHHYMRGPGPKSREKGGFAVDT